jgi:hypothetical protein
VCSQGESKGTTGSATPRIPPGGWLAVIGATILLGMAGTLLPIFRVLRILLIEAIGAQAYARFSRAGWLAGSAKPLSGIRTANEFTGSQVGSQPRQTSGDVQRRSATVAAGQCPGARCLAMPGDGPGLLRIEGVRGSNPISSTSRADFERVTDPYESPYSNTS